MDDENRIPRVGFSKVLYVTDLSEAGRYAFPFAASIAHKYDAELTVFHVEEKHDFEKYLVGYIDEDMWETIKSRNLRDAREILVQRKRNDAAIRDSVDRFCQDTMRTETEQPYVTYDIAVEVGDPVEKIIDKVKKENYDLVVVGRHGHGIIEGSLMGDTARRVVRRCTVPVMVVQLPENENAD